MKRKDITFYVLLTILVLVILLLVTKIILNLVTVQQLPKNRNSKPININVNKDNEMPKPPLKRMPINIHTRGRTSYVQLGILSNSSKQKILPLYGKQTYQRSQRWNYYTTSDGYNLIRIPLNYKGNDCMSETGCDELMDGNSIHIDEYNDDFTVKIYDNAEYRYIPNV